MEKSTIFTWDDYLKPPQDNSKQQTSACRLLQPRPPGIPTSLTLSTHYLPAASKSLEKSAIERCFVGTSETRHANCANTTNSALLLTWTCQISATNHLFLVGILGLKFQMLGGSRCILQLEPTNHHPQLQKIIYHSQFCCSFHFNFHSESTCTIYGICLLSLDSSLMFTLNGSKILI